MMKANVYKIILEVVDFENSSELDIINQLENHKYLMATVRGIQKKEVENWSDEHPLNQSTSAKQAFENLFRESV